MFLPCGKFTCLGDEPLSPSGEPYARGSAWLMHEAFCLESQSDIFTPHEKLHSTVKEACENAARMGVENLILYHTEDRNLPRRRELYTEEGRAFFGGSLQPRAGFTRISPSCTAFSSAERQVAWHIRTIRSDSPSPYLSVKRFRPLFLSRP